MSCFKLADVTVRNLYVCGIIYFPQLQLYVYYLQYS
jgi:hypothetical protein